MKSKMLMSTDNNRKNKANGVDDLLQDEYFITSVTKPTPESEKYWEEAVREGKIDPDDYELACFFLDVVRTGKQNTTNEEVHDLWENIEFENKQHLKKRKGFFRYYLLTAVGIAAMLLLAVILYKVTDRLPEDLQVSFHKEIEQVLPPGTSVSDIRLILAGDKSVTLEGTEADIIYNESGIAINNQETAYTNDSPHHKTIYNQLIVPLGKRSMLTFAEGTKIWVNAGTRVVYPVTFDESEREIFIDGEVFLDVTPDEKWPFVVKTKDHIIEVLGTSFNITAYEKDTIRNVVLVSGSVKINSPEDKTTYLSPNELFTYSGGMAFVKTVDVNQYVSWKSGIYQYNSESLGIVLQRLSRYYGKEISCPEHIYHLKCTGKLDLKDDLQILLNGITRMAPVPVRYELVGDRYFVSDQ